jgi:ABC-2 type transport system permease protein
MEKDKRVIRIGLVQELAYRSKFVMERLRSVLQVFLVFFLWDSVFSEPGREVFGYDRAKILTYVFGLLVVKAIVASSRASDISGIISRGELTNYLLKPVNFVRYWFARDIASRVVHVLFAIVEAGVLYLILKPPFFLQTNLVNLVGFVILTAMAIVIFFLMLTLVSFIPFWLVEQTWAPVFLFLTIAEILSGSIFPLDIFPKAVQEVMYLLPFPYLVFMPIQVYLGKVAGMELVKSLLAAGFWLVGLMIAVSWIWKRGVVHYRAEGR